MKIYRNPGYWLKNILVSYSLLESSFLYFYMLPKYFHIYTFQPISNITRLSFYFPTPHPPKTQTLVLYDLSSSEWFIKATHITNQPKHFHVFFFTWNVNSFSGPCCTEVLWSRSLVSVKLICKTHQPKPLNIYSDICTLARWTSLK